MDIGRSLDALDSVSRESLIRDIVHFYAKYGFCSSSKSYVDGEMYNILCKYGFIDDNLPPIELAQDLRVSKSKIKAFKEFRFYNNKLTENDLSSGLRRVLLDNFSEVKGDNLVFTFNNPALQLYAEKLLQENNLSYDGSFNASNMKLGIKAFIKLYELSGGSIEELEKNITKKGEKLKKSFEKAKKATNTVSVKFFEEFSKGLGIGVVASLGQLLKKVWDNINV